ncbi:AAA-like domain-containing protein [Oxynema aestuarii]|jgi:hypothetical protein|uniref:Serine/threonine protein kinase n=1 Tax=Oxynema aestuarii AP17 TaxID=2064643 RepID=A0A6H1U2X4_9CYAN|nr:AAA-like domain-containing protein [Oxynema aestuarii]QIZ72383.1 serine/threonine protein kinase [Oxynema aestuarii AP17]RMH71903.1 MAG: serine/threonine protein kinase [Cyanobacteria bacterium J007]
MQEQAIDLEQALQVADEAVFTKTDKHLTDVEIAIFRGAWQNQTYQEMAENTDYSANYLHRVVGQKLWDRLSDALEEKVSKKNFRAALERRWRSQHSPNSHAGFAADRPFSIDLPDIEKRCYHAIAQPGALLRIKAPKRTGKTLLSAKILDFAARQGYRTAYLNLNLASQSDFTNLDRFFQWFCVSVAQMLQLPARLNDYWNSQILTSKMNCTQYFENYLLAGDAPPLVLCLDEVDLLFPHTLVAQEFLGLLRGWHEQAKVRNIWQKLHLIFVYSTEVYISLKIEDSPFNVGVPIELPEFNREQVLRLARAYGLQWSESDVSALMAMVGGHPFLVQQAISNLKNQPGMTLAEILATAPTEAGIYNHHLRRLWLHLQAHPNLLDAFKKAIASDNPVNLERTEGYQLHGVGLLQLRGNNYIPRCDLYLQYFRDRFESSG